MNYKLIENQFLQTLGKKFSRSPKQINHFLESDAELIRLADGTVLAATTDCISEEIATGLYSDSGHIGWMTVAVNISDLSAVGANPIGILLSESLPPDFPDEKLQEVQAGVEAACQAAHTHVLGGDTNESATWQMGGTALGWIPANEPIISRKGSRPGDVLFCSGPMGLGSAYAFERLFSETGKTNIAYRPVARLLEGRLVRQNGSACIDTSDGFFHALCNLMEVNDIGFHLELPPGKIAHPEVLRLHVEKKLPSWIFLAGPHGEFELLFTIPETRKTNFLKEAEKSGWHPLEIGTCTAEKRCTLKTTEGSPLEIFPCEIANAYAESKGNAEHFLHQLLKLESQWQMQQKAG